jgi:phytoene synthase
MILSPEAVGSGYAACEVETARAARNFALGIRLLPRARRRALSAIYWFSRRADDAVDGDGTIDERRVRLEEVRAELARALDGEADDPRWAAFADATARYAVPPALYHELLGGVARDLEPAPFHDWPALRAYCHGVAGVVGLIALRIFAGSGGGASAVVAEAESDAAELGYALQLTNILRDLREDAARGRWYLPLDESARFGVTPESVAAGRAEPGFDALVAFQVERARILYGAAPRLLTRLPRTSRACPAALAGVYRGILERIAADPRAILRGRLAIPAPARLARGLAAAARAVAAR